MKFMNVDIKPVETKMVIVLAVASVPCAYLLKAVELFVMGLPLGSDGPAVGYAVGVFLGMLLNEAGLDLGNNFVPSVVAYAGLSSVIFLLYAAVHVSLGFLEHLI